MTKYPQILKQLREDVAENPLAVLDYLDGLVLAANDRADNATVPGDKGKWLGVAHRINSLMKELHPHFRPTR